MNHQTTTWRVINTFDVRSKPAVFASKEKALAYAGKHARSVNEAKRIVYVRLEPIY